MLWCQTTHSYISDTTTRSFTAHFRGCASCIATKACIRGTRVRCLQFTTGLLLHRLHAVSGSAHTRSPDIIVIAQAQGSGRRRCSTDMLSKFQDLSFLVPWYRVCEALVRSSGDARSSTTRSAGWIANPPLAGSQSVRATRCHNKPCFQLSHICELLQACGCRGRGRGFRSGLGKHNVSEIQMW